MQLEQERLKQLTNPVTAVARLPCTFYQRGKCTKVRSVRLSFLTLEAFNSDNNKNNMQIYLTSY